MRDPKDSRMTSVLTSLADTVKKGVTGHVVGVGLDMVDTRRIDAVLARYPQAFVDRVFAAQEQAYAQMHRCPASIYAKRFAAKEAFSKAVGTGIGRMLRWNAVWVDRDAAGQPHLILDPDTHAAVAQHLGHDFMTLLSLADEAPYALAVVVVMVRMS